MRELVTHSPAFARFGEDVDACLGPDVYDGIPLHQTEYRPKSIARELNFDTSNPAFTDTVRPVFGDQLSISRLRTLFNRAGHDTLANSYAYAVFGPGLFHHQVALVN